MSPAIQSPNAAPTLRTVLGALAVPAVALDAGDLVLEVNAAAEGMLAVSSEAAIGRAASDVVLGLATAVRVPLEGVARGTTLLLWPGGTVVDATTVELQRTDVIGRLAGGMAHGLANPLGAIISFSSLLADEPGVPDDLKETAGLLHGEADRTLRLVRGTLEFVRRKPPTRNRVALAPLVRECLDLTAHSTASLELQVTVSEVMPELDTDAGPLRQAILAVLVNAVELMGGTWAQGPATATGKLRIAGHLAEEDGRYRARLTFDDTGACLPEDKRATVFDGMGGRSSRDLAVAAALVGAAGGRAYYEALPEGNRIVLELPLAVDPPLPRRAAAASAPAGPRGDRAAADAGGASVTPSGSSDTARAAGGTWAAPGAAPEPASTPAGGAGRLGGAGTLTVLVCDDEPSIRALLVRVITRVGHNAREASGGAEALAILEAAAVDLVMADQRMPDMSGVDLYRTAVEKRPELATRFVLMSGDANTPELVDFAGTTGLRVIEKPFDLSAVKAMLEQLARS